MKRVVLPFVIAAAIATGGCGKSGSTVSAPDSRTESSGTEAPPQPAQAEEAKETVGERLSRHYRERVAAFAAENAGLPESQRYVVFVGDSLTEGFDLKTYFPDLKTLNRGIVADGITPSPGMAPDTGLRNRMDESIFDCQPRAIVLLLGANHMPHESEDIRELMEDYRRVYEETRAAFPDVLFIVNTVSPAGNARKDRDLFNQRTRLFNGLLREFAGRNSLPLVDLYSLTSDTNGVLRDELTGDGIHFKPAAYEIWANALREKIPAGP